MTALSDDADVEVDGEVADHGPAHRGDARGADRADGAQPAVDRRSGSGAGAGRDGADPAAWSGRQLASVTQRVLAVLAVMGLIGYGAGALRGSSHVARAEFVYTLDESVPDSFLREDRRLLTQVVTFKSDAVLTPVANRFDLSVDELRAKIDVETLELSEVLRLDVSDGDPDRAVSINRAVLDQYLEVLAAATPAGNSAELTQRRVAVAAELAEADAERLALLQAGEQDSTLEIQQESVQRRIDLKNEQVNRIQALLDDSLFQTLSDARQDDLTEQLQVAQEELAALEADLVEIVAARAELATQTTAEPALLREISRLETKLATIDEELAERELGPLVASPIRELSEPVVLYRSIHIVGLQGMAIGVLLALPIAALVAYRTRRRELWFGLSR